MLDTIEAEKLGDHVREMGKRFMSSLAALHLPMVTEIRGRGLLIGVELADAIGPLVEQAARDAGFIINAARPNVLRIAPPLIISNEQIDQAVAALPGILDTASRAAAAAQS